MATHYISQNNEVEYYNLNMGSFVAPGDTIIMAGGTWISFNMGGLTGSAENPITIRVDEPMFVGNTPENIKGYGIIIQGQHWKFLGQGNVTIYNSTYYTDTCFVFGSSSDFEVSGITIKHGKAGIFGNPSTGGAKQNIKFKDIHIQDMSTGSPYGQGVSEGIYFGNTSLQNLDTVSYNNVTFENILLEDLDGDGLQIALTQNAIIKNVHIRNFGRKNSSGQRNGIVIGGSSQATIENCLIEDGTGAGIVIFGVNKTIVKDTKILRTSTGDINENAVYIDKKGDMVEPLLVELDNVLIDGSSKYGIFNDDAIDVYVKDTFIVNSTSGATSGPNFRFYTSRVPIYTIEGWTNSNTIKTFFTSF